MAIISHPYNLLFIMTPRTACTAVGKILCQELNGRFLPQKDILDSQRYFLVQKKHCTLLSLLNNQLLSKEEASSLLKFTCVRNPFDSLVSLYVKKRSKYQPLLANHDSWVYRLPNYAKDMKFCQTHSFNAWILKNYLRGSLKSLAGFKPSMFEQFTRGVDFVMSFENIQSDFQTVLRRANISKNLTIPAVNRTRERTSDYRRYYYKLSRKIVEFAFRYDLERFGYSF